MFECPSDFTGMTYDNVTSALMLGFQDRNDMLSGYYGYFSHSPQGVGNNDIGRTFCMVENWEVATKGISYSMTNWQWPSATMSIDYYYTNSYDHVPVLNTFTFETVYAQHIRSLSWFRRFFNNGILQTFTVPSKSSIVSKTPSLRAYSYSEWWREYFPDEPSYCSGFMESQYNERGYDLYDTPFYNELARALSKATSAILYFNNEEDYGWHAVECQPNWVLDN